MQSTNKPIPKRYRVEYQDCSVPPVPSETWEWDRMRLLAMHDFGKKLIEELGTAESLVRDLARWFDAIRNAKNLHAAELHAEQALSHIPKELLP